MQTKVNLEPSQELKEKQQHLCLGEPSIPPLLPQFPGKSSMW